jgi:hypothetical protein
VVVPELLPRFRRFQLQVEDEKRIESPNAREQRPLNQADRCPETPELSHFPPHPDTARHSPSNPHTLTTTLA